MPLAGREAAEFEQRMRQTTHLVQSTVLSASGPRELQAPGNPNEGLFPTRRVVDGGPPRPPPPPPLARCERTAHWELAAVITFLRSSQRREWRAHGHSEAGRAGNQVIHNIAGHGDAPRHRRSVRPVRTESDSDSTDDSDGPDPDGPDDPGGPEPAALHFALPPALHTSFDAPAPIPTCVPVLNGMPLPARLPAPAMGRPCAFKRVAHLGLEPVVNASHPQLRSLHYRTPSPKEAEDAGLVVAPCPDLTFASNVRSGVVVVPLTQARVAWSPLRIGHPTMQVAGRRFVDPECPVSVCHSEVADVKVIFGSIMEFVEYYQSKCDRDVRLPLVVAIDRRVGGKSFEMCTRPLA